MAAFGGAAVAAGLTGNLPKSCLVTGSDRLHVDAVWSVGPSL